jgi:hypothetical protein
MNRTPAAGGSRLLHLLCVLWLADAYVATRHAVANCEAGGYDIHTIADYKKTTRQKVYLFYAVKDEVIQVRMNTLDQARMDNLGEKIAPAIGEGPVQVRFRSSLCVVNDGWQLDPAYTGDFYSSKFPYRIHISSCPGLASRIPSEGYLIADVDKRTVQLPFGELAVAPLKVVDDEITRDVEADLAKRSFDVETYDFASTGPWAPPTGRIPKERIVSRKITATRVGDGAASLLMVIASLRIDRVRELFQPYEQESLRESVRDGDKVDFPVIYFKHPAHRAAYFVGDGSWCSSSNFTPYKDTSVGAVGEFNRFRISRALDFDGDGGVDVLHINDAFAYSVDRKGHIEVIDTTFGC